MSIENMREGNARNFFESKIKNPFLLEKCIISTIFLNARAYIVGKLFL
jgi:hypothetical protein